MHLLEQRPKPRVFKKPRAILLDFLLVPCKLRKHGEGNLKLKKQTKVLVADQAILKLRAGCLALEPAPPRLLDRVWALGLGRCRVQGTMPFCEPPASQARGSLLEMGLGGLPRPLMP